MTQRISLLLAALAALALPSAGNAALVTFSDPSAYAAQLVSMSLSTTGFTNFDSMSPGALGTSFTAGGILFTSSDGMRIASDITSSPANFLGYDDILTADFQTGDQITLTLPSNSRAVSLQIITDTDPDPLAYASLTVSGQGAISIPGGTMLSGGFRSYFLGIISDTDNIESAVVDFSGTGMGFYRVDDVGAAGLTAVPEPSSLILVAAVCMTGLVRRRPLRSASH